MSDDRDRRVAEQWFLRRGLPAIVRGRPAQLLVRIVPALVALTALQVMLEALSALDGQSDEDFERMIASPWLATAYVLLLAGLIVVPAVGAWLAARWVRRRFVELGGTAAAVSAVVVFVLVLPTVDGLTGSDQQPVLDAIVRLILVGALLVVAFFGGGSILGWALRAAVRQTRSLRALTGRALPLLMLFNVLGFLTNEIWQMAATLMFAFFVVFGLISVNRGLMKTWSGHALTAGKLFGVQVPVPDELLQVSLFIAAFSGLYFIAAWQPMSCTGARSSTPWRTTWRRAFPRATSTSSAGAGLPDVPRWRRLPVPRPALSPAATRPASPSRAAGR